MHRGKSQVRLELTADGVNASKAFNSRRACGVSPVYCDCVASLHVQEHSGVCRNS